MLTRRTVLGAGLAFAAVAGDAGFGVCGSTARSQRDWRPIDALLIDESIEMPSGVAASVETRSRTLPVIGIQLDAAAYAKLTGVLDKSQAIVGISSGATLFCLERIAWDHGFRLTGRSHQCDGDAGDDAFRRNVAAFLSGAHPRSASPSPLPNTYRPSRADGVLHAWVMRKSASPQLRHGWREV